VRLADPPQLNLPAGRDSLFTYWSTAGFPATVNGVGGFDTPTAYGRLEGEVTGFPDARSVTALRRIGVRSVLLHVSLAHGTPWQGAERKPIGGLPLTKRTMDGVVVFRLR
jgi:hypothetical protein